jgi:ElaB/YqjD/DUF883 family membrane-anchored ribosome-binding protein
MDVHIPSMSRPDSKHARERLVADLQAVVRDSEDLLKATARDMSDAAQQARVRLTAGLEKARATCAEWQDQGLATAKEAAKSTDAAIRSHPYESIAVAFGVGVLIGALWKSR